MKTTLTLDTDNAVRLEKFSKERGMTFDEAVNDLIRFGLNAADKPIRPQPFKTRVLTGATPNYSTQEELKALIDQIQLEDDLRKMALSHDSE